MYSFTTAKNFSCFIGIILSILACFLLTTSSVLANNNNSTNGNSTTNFIPSPTPQMIEPAITSSNAILDFVLPPPPPYVPKTIEIDTTKSLTYNIINNSPSGAIYGITTNYDSPIGAITRTDTCKTLDAGMTCPINLKITPTELKDLTLQLQIHANLGSIFLEDPTTHQITVLDSDLPPTITKQPQNQTVVIGSPVTLTVEAIGSYPLHYKWTKDGNPIGQDNNTFSISKATNEDNGSYAVTISNDIGTKDSDPATLTVTGEEKPVILSSSNHNLLSENGATATGKVIIKNSGDTTSFDVKSSVAPIVVDNNSACFKPTATGETCEFDVSYTGTPGSSLKTTPIPFEIISQGSTEASDTITINLIDVDANTFYNPTIYGTNAKGIESSVTSLVTLQNGGVSFLYAGTNGQGIYKTSDTGTTWMPATNDLLKSETIHALYVYKDNLYAGSENGVFKTNDGGINWTLINKGLTNETVYTLCSDSNNLYAGTAKGGVFKTSDAGESWTPIHNEITTDDSVVNLYSDGSNLYAATYGSGIFKTSDAGIHWTLINTGLTNLNVYVLYSHNNYLYAGTDNGVCKTSNGGGNWTSVNEGITGNKYVHTLYSDDNNLYAGTVEGGIFKTYDDGENWFRIDNGLMGNDQSIVKALHSDGVYLYAGIEFSGIYKTNDVGKNWQLTNTKMPSNTYVSSLYQQDTEIYVGTNNGIFKTTSSDGGANWTKY